MDELTFKLFNVCRGWKNCHVLVDVRTVVIEGDEQVVWNVDVAGLNLVDDPLSQVEDRIFVRLDGPGVNGTKCCNVDHSKILY